MENKRPESTVFVVDDDSAVRMGLEDLLDSAGLSARSYASAKAFLAEYNPNQPGCLVLDLRMPEMGGFELQEHLKEQGIDIPIIIITGHGDVSAARCAFKMGAIDFLEKPFDDAVLLGLIKTATEQDLDARKKKQQIAAINLRIEQLSRREREVMDLVVVGYPNKRIAAELGIAQRTVEDHRANVMKKMQADSVAQLVSLIAPWKTARPNS